MNCLIDADALIALAQKEDSNHHLADKTIRYIEKNKITQVLSPFTIAEAVTAMSRKMGHQKAKKLLATIRKQNLGTLILKNETAADKWFVKQSKKKAVSYFDCYNLALLEEYAKSTSAIFSFDKIYPKNGFKLASQLITKK